MASQPTPVPVRLVKHLGLKDEQAARLYVTDWTGQKDVKSGSWADQSDGESVDNACIVQIHYRADVPADDVCKYRGWVFDMTGKEPALIARSYAYTKPIEIKVKSEKDGKVACTLPDWAAGSRMSLLRDGNVIRAYVREHTCIVKGEKEKENKHACAASCDRKGKQEVYYSTHRRVDCTRSVWSNPTKTFKQMLFEAAEKSKFDLATLFPTVDSKMTNTEYCFVFFVIHQENQFTNTEAVEPQLLFLDAFKRSEKGGMDISEPPKIDGLLALRPTVLSDLDANLNMVMGRSIVAYKDANTPYALCTPQLLEQRRIRGNEPNIKLAWYRLLGDREEEKLRSVLHPSKHALLDGFRRELNYEIEANIPKDQFPLPMNGTLVSFLFDLYIEYMKKRAAAKGKETEELKTFTGHFTKQIRNMINSLSRRFRDHYEKMTSRPVSARNRHYAKWVRQYLEFVNTTELYVLIRDFHKQRAEAERRGKTAAAAVGAGGSPASAARSPPVAARSPPSARSPAKNAAPAKSAGKTKAPERSSKSSKKAEEDDDVEEEPDSEDDDGEEDEEEEVLSTDDDEEGDDDAEDKDDDE